MKKLSFVLLVFLYMVMLIPAGFAQAEEGPADEGNTTGEEVMACDMPFLIASSPREESTPREEDSPNDQNANPDEPSAAEEEALSAGEAEIWEQTGVIRYGLGYQWLLSGEAEADGASGFQTGFRQEYYIDLKGYLVRSGHDLSYSLTLSPDDGLGGAFNWSSPWFKAQYDKGIRLRIPNVRIAFANHQIDGFSFQTRGDNLITFAGQESYIPQYTTFTIVNPNENIYYLYEPASAGDIVQQSELIILDGRVLTSQRDYTLNYLNGKLKLYVPLSVGMRLEAKYFFILHNPDLIDARGEFLAGVVLNKSWLENSLSAFYIQRGKDLNKVAGAAGRVSYGPVLLEGEWAVSKAAKGTPVDAQEDPEDGSVVAAAYDLRGGYTTELVQLTYELRDVSPSFQEIGVVPYLKGKSNLWDLTLHLDTGTLQWESSEFVVREGEEERVNRDQVGTLKCDLAPHHVAQMIFQKTDTQLGGETKNNVDFSIGYLYESRPLNISLGQSIQNPENHFVKLKMNYANLIIDGQYTVDTLWQGKEHHVNLEGTYRPVEQIELNSFLEYTRPFDEAGGNTFLQVNGNWIPNPAWSATTGYVFNENNVFRLSNHRVYLLANYQTAGRNSNLYMEHFNLDSLTAHSTDTEVNWSYGMTLFSDYQLNYQLQYDHFIETDKFNNRDLQATTDHIQNLALQYQFADHYALSARIGYSRQDLMNMGDWVHAAEYSGGVDFRYQSGTEREIYLGASMQQGGRDAGVELNSRVLFPLGKAKIDYQGNFTIPLAPRGERKTTLHLQLAAPPVWKINPELLYDSEYTQLGGAVTLEKAVSGILRYNWTEQRSIFLEAKQETSVNTNIAGENYSCFGLYAGIELNF